MSPVLVADFSHRETRSHNSAMLLYFQVQQILFFSFRDYIMILSRYTHNKGNEIEENKHLNNHYYYIFKKHFKTHISFVYKAPYKGTSKHMSFSYIDLTILQYDEIHGVESWRAFRRTLSDFQRLSPRAAAPRFAYPPPPPSDLQSFSCGLGRSFSFQQLGGPGREGNVLRWACKVSLLFTKTIYMIHDQDLTTEMGCSANNL